MGLRTKITLALFSLALIPLGITTTLVAGMAREHLERSTKEYRLATAEGVVSEVSLRVKVAQSDLDKIGAALCMSDQDLEARLNLAKAALAGSGLIHEVTIYDPDGLKMQGMTAGGAPSMGAPPGQLDEDLRGVARTEGSACLATALGQDGKRAFLPVIVPMFRGQQRVLYGYLWAPVPLAPMNAVVGQASRRRFGQIDDRVYILDDSLRVVVHASPAEVGRSIKGRGVAMGLSGNHLPHKVAFSSEYELKGQAMLGELVPIPSLGWGVVVEQPRAEAYSTVQRTWQAAMLIGLLSAALALAVGTLLGRRLAAPVLQVARAAGDVAGGNFDVQLAIRSRDEVGRMATAFNRMTSDLRGYRDRLVDETKIRTELSRYLTAELVEQVVERKTELELGGQRQQVTVLFADVVSFTPMAEKHDPEFVVGILNELFSFLTEIVFKNGGTVDKFIGDCVMAVFGAPYTHDDDPLRAVRAAEEMLHWLEVGNAKWRKDLGKDLQLAVGINTGEAVVGNIGSKRRMEYTVIGDTVNVAARLEALARPGQVLMTAATRDRVSSRFDCVSIGEHKLSGKGEPMEIFALEVE